MFRFNLSRIVFPIAALAVLVTGCSQKTPDMTKAEPVGDVPVFNHETRWESQQDYLECPNGASLRLMYKWLEVPHEATLPDSCMPLTEAVKLVEERLPGIKSFIDANNAAIHVDWEQFQEKIDETMQLSPNTALRVLLDMRCNDESVEDLDEARLRWTPFLGTTPAEVRAAIDRIVLIDDQGYGITINVGHRDGSTTTEPYDEHWYQSTTEEEPLYENEEGYYTRLSDSEIYGSYGNMPYYSLIQSFYDGMRLRATDADDMPVHYENGAPFCYQ